MMIWHHDSNFFLKDLASARWWKEQDEMKIETKQDKM